MKYRIEVELGRSGPFGSLLTWTRSDYQTAMEQIQRHVDDVRYVTLHEIGDDDELEHIIREHAELSEEVVELRDDRAALLEALREAAHALSRYTRGDMGSVNDEVVWALDEVRRAIARATGETENEERES